LQRQNVVIGFDAVLDTSFSAWQDEAVAGLGFVRAERDHSTSDAIARNDAA
jgi:hypothetical protein